MSLITKVLIVVSSHSTLGSTGKPTGYWLSEVTHPYVSLAEQGFNIDIASPEGGKAPMDPGSFDLNDGVNKAFWGDSKLRDKLEHTLRLDQVKAAEYSAIFFAGGHGGMWDFPENASVQSLVSTIYEQGGIVSAVCHGQAALVNIKLKSGRYLVDGKRVTGFSNAEEEAVKLTTVVPFALESKLKERGGQYQKAGLWEKFVIKDERLVTGQNPASASAVGQAVAELLKSGAKK